MADFGWALQALKDGGSVRRACWNPSTRIKFHGEQLFSLTGSVPTGWSASGGALKAEDWEPFNAPIRPHNAPIRPFEVIEQFMVRGMPVGMIRDDDCVRTGPYTNYEAAVDGGTLCLTFGKWQSFQVEKHFVVRERP